MGLSILAALRTAMLVRRTRAAPRITRATRSGIRAKRRSGTFEFRLEGPGPWISNRKSGTFDFKIEGPGRPPRTTK
eukprot:13388043-Alexandrium_andersonii.AAC.1